MRFLSQRGFTLIGLIIVLVIIAGGIWLYFALFGGDDNPPPKPDPTVVVSEDWKIKNASRIAVNDRRWSAPLLFEISDKVTLKDSTLMYTATPVRIYCHPSSNNLKHFLVKESHGIDSFNIGWIGWSDRGWTDSKYELFKLLCHKSDEDFTMQSSGHNKPIFDNSIFDKTTIIDAETRKSGFGLWLYNVGQHEPLFKAVKLLLEQYHDLAERLTVLHEGHAKIIKEYGKGSNVKALDSDIKKRSALGWNLTKVTKRFFVAIKPRMIKLEVAATRQQALAGLRTFENEIDSAQTTSSQSLDDIIANIDQAVRKLERAINQ